MASYNNHYNRKYKGLARGLRKNSTKAEIRLWCELLRGKSLRGYGFLRQRPIGNYIVDFLSKELKLVIEVDGAYHNFRQQEDNEKDNYLKSIGISVIRFRNEEVISNIDYVKKDLEEFIDNFESRKT